jgi:hypothetical protein
VHGDTQDETFDSLDDDAKARSEMGCFWAPEDTIPHQQLLANDRTLPKSTRLGWGVMGYWGGLLLIGRMHRLWKSAWYIRGGGDSGDAEHKQQRQLR